MTRASDLTDEQRFEHERRMRATLDRVDTINAGLQAREAERRASGASLDELLTERQQQQAEQERASAFTASVARSSPPPAPPRPAMDAETAAAWNRWANDKIEARLRNWAKAMIDAEQKELIELFTLARKRTNERIAQAEAAAVALCTDLEHRLLAVEDRLRKAEKRAEEAERPAPTRLHAVGFQGGAAAHGR